jgi:uncharacterized protein (UPF0548 family)
VCGGEDGVYLPGDRCDPLRADARRIPARSLRSLAGGGVGVFERAATALLAWQAQIGAGIEVFPSGSQVEDRATVVLLLRAGLWAPAPCRVAYVLDEPDRAGFAYGTLPGHPECGEVSFIVTRDTGRHVALIVRSFSRRVDPLARLGAPVARVVQTRVTRRYLEALAAAARAS